jgi:UDP-2,3-diacylglucosamine hydrolase
VDPQHAVQLVHPYNGSEVTTLFVSDLHLDAAWPAAGAQFMRFLRAEAARADALYILGDLFESWVGDDDRDPQRTAWLQALRELTIGGVPAFVLHGNRDFLLGARFAADTGAMLLPDPCTIELYGQRVLLTHGDLLCSGDLGYQRLRAQVRRASWQRRFLALPLATRRWLAGAARAGSRQHMQRLQPDIMDVDAAAVDAALAACGVRTLIHGHTHRPGVHRLQLGGAPTQRIVLGAWYEQGSVLRWQRDGSLQLDALVR